MEFALKRFCLSHFYRCGIFDSFILCGPPLSFLSPSLSFPFTTDCATAAHVEHLLPRAGSLWHTRELQSCMLSSVLPLSLSLSLCQIRTAIELGKIERRTYRLNVIWFTVDLYLAQTTVEPDITEYNWWLGEKANILCGCNGRKHLIWNKYVPLVGFRLCVCTFMINLHYSHLSSYPLRCSGFPPSHQVSHLFICYVTQLHVCMYDPRGVYFVWFFWQTRMTACSCVPLRPPQGCSLPCPNNSRASCTLGIEPRAISTNVRLVPCP